MSENDVSTNNRTPQQRKEILRTLVSKTESLEDDTINDNTLQALEECMEETDHIISETSLEEKLLNQEEVLLDSEIMNVSSRILKRYTRSFKCSKSSYDPAEFAQKLVQYISECQDERSSQRNIPDWSVLKTQAIKCFKRTPNYSTLLGTLEPLEVKQINKRKPVTTRDAHAEIKRPDNITTVEKEEEGLEQTVKMKEFISHYYKKTGGKPVDFFKLVLHPNDFGKTIENILQISFLIRDRKVKITKDDSNFLVILPCTKEMTQMDGAGNPYIQNIISLNMEQWKTLVDAYQINKPMIDFDRNSQK